jgi:peptidoglycan biosynthesis protein MviN/MurJ (putative lipid II flippase)
MSARPPRAAASVRTPVILSVLSVGASLLGFASQLMQAHRFGASAVMDAFAAMYTIPAVLTGLMPAVVAAAVIPELSHADVSGRANRATSSLSLVAIVAALSLAAAGWVLAPAMVAIGPARSEEPLRTMTVQAARLVGVALSVFVLGSYLSALCQRERRFLRPAIAPLLPPAATIVLLALVSSRLGTVSIALGLLVGVVAQLLVLGMRPARLFPGGVDVDRATILAVGRRVPSVVAAMLPITLLPAIAARAASPLESGALTTLAQGQSLATILSVTVSYGLAMMSLTDVADDFASGRNSEARQRVSARARIVVLLAALCAGVVGGVGDPLLRLLYQRGAYDEVAVLRLLSLLPWFLAAGVLAAAVNVFRTTLLVGRGTVGLAGTGALAAGGFMGCAMLGRHEFGATAIAAGYLLAWVILALGAAALGGHLTGAGIAAGTRFLARTTVVASAGWIAGRLASTSVETSALGRVTMGVAVACGAMGVLIALPVAPPEARLVIARLWQQVVRQARPA